MSEAPNKDLTSVLSDMEDDIHSVVDLTMALMMLGSTDDMPRDVRAAINRVAYGAWRKAKAVREAWETALELSPSKPAA